MDKLKQLIDNLNQNKPSNEKRNSIEDKNSQNTQTLDRIMKSTLQADSKVKIENAISKNNKTLLEQNKK